MRRCLGCGALRPYREVHCPGCGAAPARVDGFDSYAPEMARSGEGFKEEYFRELARLEGENFWFRARNRLILWALRTYGPGFGSMLEVGCGTAYVLSGVAAAFPQARLTGSEAFTEGLRFARQRLPGVEFLQMDARRIPFAGEFDVVGAFDVIEHIREDEAALAQMYQALRPGGLLVLTVPQHRWLWSAVDEYACHFRRYTAAGLRDRVESAGFRVLRSTSFVTTLLPAMAAARWRRRRPPREGLDAAAELRIAPWLNRTFLRLLDMERALIEKGLDLPAGGSRLLVAVRD